jgi:hypothetical protein
MPIAEASAVQVDWQQSADLAKQDWACSAAREGVAERRATLVARAGQACRV